MRTPRWIPLALACVAAPVLAQSAVVAPGDNLVVQGIPPIPAAIAHAVGRYTDFRSASFSDWHPARREMLISTRFGEVPQIHHVRFPGGARTQLTFFPDRVSTAFYRPKTGNYFVFSKDTGGNEFSQLYRYDPATGDSTLLTDGKSRNTGGGWSTSGELLAFQSNRRNGRDSDVYLINPAEPLSSRLLAECEGGGWRIADWSPDDRRIAAIEFISANESYLWLIDATTGAKTAVTPRNGSPSEPVAYTSAEFSADGEGLYVTTDRDSEFQRLAYVDLGSRSHAYLTDPIKWDVEDLDLSPDGRRIAFASNEDGVSVLRLLDTATGKIQPGPKLPVGVLSGVRWHSNNRDIGFNLTTARSATDAYSFDARSGRLERWTFSEAGGLNTEEFPEPELVRWKSFDGKSISGFLYRPPAKFTGKRPVVISIHGGPESQFRPQFPGRNAYYLNELGIAILAPNVRGSSGYGKTFLKLDNGMQREDSYKDVGALLDWIKGRPDLDPDRVMVTGGSYGGHMTLAVATLYPDRIRCALPVVGMSNLVTFLERTESYRRDLRRAEYGDERDPKVRAFMERTAPLNHAAKITKPMLVVQGKNDPRVPYTESEQIVAALRKNGTPVWFLMANDEGHGFAKKRNVDFQFYATVLFMQEHLLK